MTEQRLIVEMGMGNDLHGQDYTKAAARAIEDALRHSSLQIFGETGLDAADMRVDVTVGVQNPDRVDCDALMGKLPHGKVSVRAVSGGLDIAGYDGRPIVIASASVQAFLPKQSGWRIRSD
ncbi:MAG: Lin0512 family protein [Pseudomonadota bacterium]